MPHLALNDLEQRTYRQIIRDSFVEGELLKEAKENGKLEQLRKKASAFLRDLSNAEIMEVTAIYFRHACDATTNVLFQPLEIAIAYKRAKKEGKHIFKVLEEMGAGVKVKKLRRTEVA